MINKEIILNADGTIKKDFSDRAIPQNSNNQVSVNVLIPSTCFTGLQNYAVLLAVSRIIGNSETTLNTLVMSVSKSITIDGVVYVKYTAYLTIDYTDKLGQLKLSPYIQTTATTLVDDVATEVITIQQAFTNSNLNIIKSVLPQYDASLEEGTIATTLEGQINAKKIYTFVDTDSASLGEHYYSLVNGYDPTADQFKGCIVVSVFDGETRQYIPYLNDGDVELLEITKDGIFYNISGVDYSNSTYTYTRQQISYSKSEVDSQVSDLQTQINGKVDKTQKVNGHALSGDITLTKSDVGLGNVANYGVESTPTASGESLYITSKGVYDALQLVYTAISGCATDDDLTTINNRLDSIEAIIGSDDGDADINGLGEGANLLDLINAKANQSDLTALNNQINGENGIKDKVDLLSERTNAYMEIKNSLGTIDIAVSDWEANIGDTDYPYKWELTNGYLEGAVNCIVVYSKDSDTSMLSATTGIDEENGKLIIYASELPTETISIEKIAVFNDLNAYINYSNEIVQQVLQNTQAISDINNTKLPQYVKSEVKALNETIINEIINISSVGGLSFKTRKPSVSKRASIDMENSAILLETEDFSASANAGIGELELKKDSLTIRFYDSNYDSHRLTFDSNGDLKIDGNAVGGGKQLYQHNITINHTDGGLGTITLQIISDSDTAFTLTSFYNYIKEKYSTSGVSDKKGLICNGIFNYGGTTYLAVNLFFYSTSSDVYMNCSQINGNYSSITPLMLSVAPTQASLTDLVIAL